VCVRFFTGKFENRECNPKTEDRGTNDGGTNDCRAPGDVCNQDGRCKLDPAQACNPTSEDNDQCSFDELCSFTAEACMASKVPGSITDLDACGRCVARSSEIRFCMRTCESDDDCRDGYECRDFDDMKLHGGEPVLDRKLDRTAPRYCAVAPL
jgi:hypothetical protein